MKTMTSTTMAGVIVSVLQLSQVVSATSSPINREVRLHRRQLDQRDLLRTRNVHRRGFVDSSDAATTSSSSNPVTQSAPTTDLATWTAQVESNCAQSVNSLGGAIDNPTGLVACYNVPFIDPKSGAFAAELRMYNVSAPTAEWAGVTTQQVQISLAYLGATVQPAANTPDLTPNQIARRHTSPNLRSRQAASTSANQIQTLSFIGKMDPNLLAAQMDQAQLQKLLIPQIEVTAANPSSPSSAPSSSRQADVMLATVLSSKQATVTNGVFADASDKAFSPADVEAAARLVDSLRPFVIPGVTLAFFPVGLVVTGLWVLLFVGAIGAGTVGRYLFAEEYKRSVKARA